ncbi:MAG: DNA-formamidopyrimidine glycosylase family protein, partial [Pseudomonadota bacterium]
MPELPEVETVGRGLANAVLGATIAKVDQRRPDLRWPMPNNLPARLAGRRWADIRRRGKYLLITMDDGQVMLL